MNNTPIWKSIADETVFPPLKGDLSVDVTIIGGGITGITTAMLLAQAGKSVAVLEASKVGSGTTGLSTGNLYVVVADHLFAIGEKWGETTMQTVVDVRTEAIKLIENTVKTNAIDCDFFRRPLYLFTTDLSEEYNSTIEKEYQAVVNTRLNAKLTDDVPYSSFNAKKALIVENQAQFHPLKYIRGIARTIASDQCRIFENAKVITIDDKHGTVATEEGRITSEKIVLATHTPKGFNVLQTELGPYREYGIAARIDNGDFPEGIFWSLGPTRHSIRSYNNNGNKYVLVIGEIHKTGQKEKTQECYEKLEKYLRAHFSAGSIEYRWSAQHYQPADELPYIGRSIGSTNTYVATGFSKDGLVYGTLAALLISDDIMERQTTWSSIFDSRRFNPAKSAKHFISENLNVAGYYLKDYLKSPDTSGPEALGKGEGKLIKVNGERVAAYRDDNGKLFLLSPICSHLKCLVHWNNAEQTWDCPCHGSRFRFDGEVIEGPAIAALERKFPELE